MRSLTPRFGTFVMLAALLVAGCGSGRVAVSVALEPAAVTRPAAAPRATDEALRAVAGLFRRDLGLPLPAAVTVFVYADRAAFAQGLVDDAGVAPARAAELSEFAVGISKRRQLFFNDAASRARGPEWLRLIAHELAHVSQIELADGEERVEQWLAEGAAEWVAFTVLERSGLDTLARRRRVATAGIRNHAALAAARLDLETLGSPRGFTVRHQREGSLPTYQLAFLMADYLIGRDGLTRVLDYFRSFAVRQDRYENFRRTFGQGLDEFEREVLTHLRTVVR